MTNTRSGKIQLSLAQREVLAAIARGVVYGMQRPPYTTYVKDQQRPVRGATIEALFRHGLIEMGRRERFIRYFKLADAVQAAADQGVDITRDLVREE